MRTFNTSGPNFPKQHYTIKRTEYIARGIDFVENSRYFTIWAPRQTGKSTYFLQLAEKLNEFGYKTAISSVEDFRSAKLSTIVRYFCRILSKKYCYWSFYETIYLSADGLFQ